MQARRHAGCAGRPGFHHLKWHNGAMSFPFGRFSCLTFVLFAAASACKRAETPTGPTPSADTVVYVAIGASDAIGVGSSVVCFGVIDCPNGTSYVYVLQRQLQAAGKTVTVTNLGVPGAVMSPAIQALTRQIGRTDVIANFLEHQVPFVTSSHTHVTIFAGGNDANAIAQAIRAGVPGSDTPNDIRAYIDRQVQQWGTDLEELVRRVRARSANARIVAFNLPNLGGMPYVSRATATERGAVQRIAVGLADRINALAGQTALVVDLLCEPRIYDAAHVSSDGFHPSDAGYRLMAELAFSAMSSGAAAAPSGSCPQRTLATVF
jgi:lysophospholipase L1-like esterase